MGKAVWSIIIISFAVMISNFTEDLLVDYGLVNPIIGGVGIPVVTGLLIFLILLFLKQSTKIEVV